MNVSAVKEWTVLSPIKSRLESNGVKMLYVFGSSGKEVIYVTSDDEVYAFGENCWGVLGFGHTNAVNEPTLIRELCGKPIKLIQSNNGDRFDYLIALTKSGQLYSWGENYYGCLGNYGIDNQDSYEPNLINALNGVTVIDICCGNRHCLALSESGDVYGWGAAVNAVNGNHEIQTFPIKVMALSGMKIISIACGESHSMAVTESGVVYGWGYNSEGQLGTGNTTHQFVPIKVELSEKITKVCAGFEHTLLLSSAGEVYAFGDNSEGQIGDGSKKCRSTPVRIAFPIKIAYILASNRHHISLAMTIDNRCYVWGVNDWTVPKEIIQNNFNDAFNYCLDKKVTIKPLTFTYEWTPILFRRLANSLNVEKYSDIKFVIEGKQIFAQKLYLMSVCKHFDIMFSNEWLESSSNEIPITQYSYSVYYSFLKFLYTNKVEIKIEEALDLLDLANCYFDAELKKKCIEFIKNNIDIENVCHMFIESLKHNCEQLADYCADFASNKWKHISKTEDFDRMDGESLKQLIREMHK